MRNCGAVVVALARVVDRESQVRMVGLEAVEPRRCSRPLIAFSASLHKTLEVVDVAAADLFFLAHRGKLLECVVAHVSSIV